MPIEKEDGGVVNAPTPTQAKAQAANEAALAAAKSKNVKELTKPQIDAATAKTVAAGGKSTDPANRLKGETASQANARITAAYKEMTAKPVLSEEQIKAGAKVKFVRTGAGGQGEYTVVVPPGYKGPRTTTQWTDGIIPANSKYTTGTSLGKTVSGGKLAPGSVTTKGTTTSTTTTTNAPTGKAKTITEALGSDLEKFRIDPKTGKQRTSEEIVKAAVDAALQLPDSAWGTTYDETTGKTTTVTKAQKVSQILAQLSANAKRNAPNREFSKAVADYLGSDINAATSKFLQGDKTSWKYQPGFIEGTATESGKVVLDPNKTSLTPEELKQYTGKNVNFIDPVTGATVDVDLASGAIQWGDLKERLASVGGKVDTGASDNPELVVDKPVGTPPAFVYNDSTGEWEMPEKPTEEGSWTWDNNKGWVDSTVNAGSTGDTTEGGPTLAANTFKNTLALFFGTQEMSQPWVDVLYKSVLGFVNTGSDIQEALNMSLQDVRNNPTMKPFTDRFKGIYALQDRLARGEAVTVPTIAEYFKTESAMGDVLRGVGLGELATQNFLGDVLGRGKSLSEVTNLINDTFNSIDNAPDALKKDLQTYFPGVDRTSIAKALLTGKEGWAELDKKVKGISVLSAAKTQGVNIDLATGMDLAMLGTDYTGALSGFQQVKELERGKLLGETMGVKFGQTEAIGAAFKQDAKAIADIEKIKKTETARYQGSAGRLASRERNVGLF